MANASNRVQMGSSFFMRNYGADTLYLLPQIKCSINAAEGQDATQPNDKNISNG